MSTYYVAGVPYSSELYHHGIKGQKWGVRRFQNPDGSLTTAGRQRYSSLTGNFYSKEGRFDPKKQDQYRAERDSRIGQETIDKVNNRWSKTLQAIYEGDYSKTGSKNVRRIENARKERDIAAQKHESDYNRVLEEERGKAGKMERFFKGSDQIEYEARQRARTKVKDLPSAKELSEADKRYDKTMQKIKGEWKDKTMREILNEIPDSKKDDVYDLLRFDWWDID